MVDYTIEPAQPRHIAALAEVERAAAMLFPPDVIPEEARYSVVPAGVLAEAQAEGRLWVALTPEDAPVGFAIVSCDNGTGLLVEVDVHPDHQRRGLGRRLIETAIAWARAQRLRALCLTTFASLPWNAPFYERLGFRRLHQHELSDDLARLLREEAARGLRDRVAMQMELEAAR